MSISTFSGKNFLLLSVVGLSFAAALAGSPAAAAAGCIPPPSNMVGWWTLDEVGPTVFDHVFGGAGAVIGGAKTVAGEVDAALQFNGKDSYVEIPDHPEINFGTGDFSIDLWVSAPPQASRGVRVILDKRDAQLHGYHLYMADGQIGLQLADAAGFTNYTSSIFIPSGSGTLHHIAVTVARQAFLGGITFYEDGVFALPELRLGDRSGSLTNTAPLRLGARTNEAAPSGFWNGVLDEVELFNRALDPSEVAAIFAAGTAGKCKCARLCNRPLAWWNFENGGQGVAGASAGSFDGFVNAVTTTPGEVGQALSFNGTSSYVSIPNKVLDLDLTKPSALSVDAWIRPKAPNGPIVGDASLIIFGTTGYLLSLVHGMPTFTFGTFTVAPPTVTSLVVTCPRVSLNAWHFIGGTVSFDAGGGNAIARLFVDGKQCGTPAGPSQLKGSTFGTNVLIGSRSTVTRTTFFNGDIDEVEIFDRELTAADFQSIFVAGSAGKCDPISPISPPGADCGTRGTQPCPAGQFCSFGADCGAVDFGGICTVQPQSCPPFLPPEPVCGCNGTTYPNPCEAARQGASIVHMGAC
jgi:hypothetical protein